MRPQSFLPFVLLLVAACNKYSDQESDLRRARARWSASNAEVGYDIVVNVFCFCPLGGDSIRIRVFNDQMAEARFVSSGDTIPASVREFIPTVRGLFDIVQRAIDTEAAGLSAAFDPQYGFPTRVDIDWIGNAADDEVGYRMGGLQLVLTGSATPRP